MAGFREALMASQRPHILEAIVRDLAAIDCEVTIPISSVTDETAVICITCETEAPWVWDDRHRQMVSGPIEHAESCPWRRAREWADAQEGRER